MKGVGDRPRVMKSGVRNACFGFCTVDHGCCAVHVPIWEEYPLSPSMGAVDLLSKVDGHQSIAATTVVMSVPSRPNEILESTLALGDSL